MQNLAPSGFSVEQFGQPIDLHRNQASGPSACIIQRRTGASEPTGCKTVETRCEMTADRRGCKISFCSRRRISAPDSEILNSSTSDRFIFISSFARERVLRLRPPQQTRRPSVLLQPPWRRYLCGPVAMRTGHKREPGPLRGPHLEAGAEMVPRNDHLICPAQSVC
jgi:hypothetical protein